jgi:hypothetical protein
MAEALVRRGRDAEQGGWEIEMTALRRLGREEVHMMNSSAQCPTLLFLKWMVFRVCLEDVLEGSLSFSTCAKIPCQTR